MVSPGCRRDVLHTYIKVFIKKGFHNMNQNDIVCGVVVSVFVVVGFFCVVVGIISKTQEEPLVPTYDQVAYPCFFTFFVVDLVHWSTRSDRRR